MLKTSITELLKEILNTWSMFDMTHVYLVYYITAIKMSSSLYWILKKKSGNIGPPKFSKMLTKTNVIISESFDYFRNIKIVIGYQKITSVETENDI